MWLAVAAIWVSCSFAISVAIYYTHDMKCLWFLLIPSLISFNSNSKDNKKEEEVDTI